MDRRPKLLNWKNWKKCESAGLRLRRWCHAFWMDGGGAEMAEWVIVVAFVLATGLAVYNRVFTSELSTAVDIIGNHILDAASGNLAST